MRDTNNECYCSKDEYCNKNASIIENFKILCGFELSIVKIALE